MAYTAGFKTRMVQRMCGSEGISAYALAKDVGISQPTLSRWRRDTRILSGMTNNNPSKPGVNRRRSPDDILCLVAEASQLSDKDLGAFLRKHGLHSTQIEEWRASMLGALSVAKASQKKSPETKRIKALEREINRKDKALAEYAALVVLKKKALELWGDEGNDTTTRSGI